MPFSLNTRCDDVWCCKDYSLRCHTGIWDLREPLRHSWNWGGSVIRVVKRKMHLMHSEWCCGLSLPASRSINNERVSIISDKRLRRGVSKTLGGLTVTVYGNLLSVLSLTELNSQLDLESRPLRTLHVSPLLTTVILRAARHPAAPLSFSRLK